MGHVVRLRISLADRAGALAQAATIIGLHGGNILSIDVHRSSGSSAVDDLVVDFSEEPNVDELRDDLAINAATTLLSQQASDATDPVVASMQRVVQLVTDGLGDPAEAIAAAVADLCSSPVAWVSDADDAIQYEAGRLALEGHSAAAQPTTNLPEHFAGRLPGAVSLLAVPDPEYLPGGRVVFVARPASTGFTATEISRIEALMDLYHQLERLVSGP
jgi:hypothetical protein